MRGKAHPMREGGRGGAGRGQEEGVGPKCARGNNGWVCRTFRLRRPRRERQSSGRVPRHPGPLPACAARATAGISCHPPALSRAARGLRLLCGCRVARGLTRSASWSGGVTLSFKAVCRCCRRRSSALSRSAPPSLRCPLPRLSFSPGHGDRCGSGPCTRAVHAGRFLYRSGSSNRATRSTSGGAEAHSAA